MTYYRVNRSSLRSFFSRAYDNQNRGYAAGRYAPDIVGEAHRLTSLLDATQTRETIAQVLNIANQAGSESVWWREATSADVATPGESWILTVGNNAPVYIQLSEPDEVFEWGRTAFDMSRVGTLVEGDVPGGESSSGLVIRRLDGWGEGYVEISPNEEALASLPERARQYAVRIVDAQAEGQVYAYTPGAGIEQIDAGIENLPTVQELIDTGRRVYRAEIRARIGSPGRDAENARLEAIRAHREKTKQNFEAFVRTRENDAEAHVGKLPFVPHGLTSSRRWGIEIEHPGARGVRAPEDWDSKGDGSLRSAYDGYVEVQDFEPFTREVVETVSWSYCDNAASHDPRVSVLDAERGEYIYLPNENYVNPTDCDTCGRITREVLVEPQTITHYAQGGDCKEFVSPILVSMHSNGLEQLLDDLKGRPTNSSAGVHVHVEADDLTKDQIATLVYGYDILEPLLEASYQRDRRDFCERRNVDEVLEAARKAKAKTGDFDYYSSGRYRTLNTHSLGDHGTVEFRAMGPVYSYDYLVRWAMLCREIVNSVSNGATTKDFAKIKSWDDLVMFIAKFGKEYVRASVFEMTGETGHQAALSKGTEHVTQNALDADLETVLSSDFQPTVTAFQRMAEAFRVLSPNADQLVGVAGLAEV